ncbi:hypothetical protein D3C86_1794170 [compost metagenome]
MLLLAIFGPIEAFEHRFAFGLGDAGAAVVDFDPGAALLCAGTQDYPTAGRGELDGIAQKVAQCLEEQGAIAMQLREVFGGLQLQGDQAFFGQRQVELIEFPQQR